MTAIKFTVPAVPIAQPRQQHRVVKPASGAEPFVMNYLPTKHPVNAFKASVQQAARAAYSGRPLDGPLALTVTFLFPRPGRLIWKKREMPRCWHSSKPDTDNCVKAVKDALNSLIFRDDSQVCDERGCKLYAAGNEQPCVIIEIVPLEEVEPSRTAIEPGLPDLFESPESPMYLPAESE